MRVQPGTLQNVFAQPKWQRVWAVANGALALVFAGADWLARDQGWGSFLAPSQDLLWQSIVLGSGLGLLALTAAWLMPRSQREFTAEFAGLPLRERLRWRHQKWNLLYSSWSLLLIWGLIGWCWLSGVFVLPGIFAANAVLFAALPTWAIPAAASGQPKQVEHLSGRDSK
jgi:hypothetical protein